MGSGNNNQGPGPADVEDAAVEELAQAADALFLAMRRARSTAAHRDSGLSLAQLTLLEPLMREQHLPVGRLAACADVSVPTATRMLKQLEGKGVVLRERSAHDERQVLVSLTEDGAAKIAEMRGRLRRRQARAFASFTPDERTQLVALTRRLTDLVAVSYVEEEGVEEGVAEVEEEVA